jgi:hypothetical protein
MQRQKIPKISKIPKIPKIAVIPGMYRESMVSLLRKLVLIALLLMVA